MELKYSYETAMSWQQEGLNCTFMELKSKNALSRVGFHHGLNCTFMELKSLSWSFWS